MPARPQSPGAVGTSLLVVAFALARSPAPVAAQFTEPCELGCVAVLGATSFVTATGVSIAVGRVTGGLTSMNQGILLWGVSFAATAGAGMSLADDGERQRRAIYAAGLGTLAGSLVGAAFGAARGGEEAHLISGTLIGAAAGALLGGVVGALTHDEGDSVGAVPLLALRLAL